MISKRYLLRERARTMTQHEFSNSLTPDEYREVTFFWCSTIEFWQSAVYSPHIAGGFLPRVREGK